MDLPEAYLAYMRSTGPEEGELTVEPGWFQLWPLDELDALNEAYGTPEFVPNFRAFGSSGGGELLAFDSDGRIAMIPCIPMSEEEAKIIAKNWADFESKMLTEPSG